MTLTPAQIMSMELADPPESCAYCSGVYKPPDNLTEYLAHMPDDQQFLDQWIREGLKLCNSKKWMGTFAHQTLYCLNNVKWAKEQYASDSDALDKLDSILLELAKFFSRFPPDRRMCMCVRAVNTLRRVRGAWRRNLYLRTLTPSAFAPWGY